METVDFEWVDIPTLIKLRAARSPAPLPYKPRAADVVEFEADDRVQQVTIEAN